MTQKTVLLTVTEGGCSTMETFSKVLANCKDKGLRIVSAGRELGAIMAYAECDVVGDLGHLDHIAHVEILRSDDPST